jgi:hypothetical protein
MEAICSSETSVETRRTTRRHIPEDDTLQVVNSLEGQIKISVDSFCIDFLRKYISQWSFKPLRHIPVYILVQPAAEVTDGIMHTYIHTTNDRTV